MCPGICVNGGEIKCKWGKVTDDDLTEAEGNMGKLVGRYVAVEATEALAQFMISLHDRHNDEVWTSHENIRCGPTRRVLGFGSTFRRWRLPETGNFCSSTPQTHL